MTRFPISLPVLAVALALAVPAVAASQVSTPAPPAEPSLRTFFTDLAADARRLPSTSAAVTIAATGILTSSLSPFDDDLERWNPRGEFEAGTLAGNGVVLAAGTLAAYGIGRWADKPRVARIAVDLLRAQVLSLGTAYGLKYTTQRERPDRSSSDSFPSGHAAQTFAAATALARHLGALAAAPAYAGAGYVAMSRVNQNRHHLTDVIFGAGLGIAVGWSGARTGSALTIAPAVSPSAIGVGVTLATP
jgi:membrane-associated phospholipid phosphatase